MIAKCLKGVFLLVAFGGISFSFFYRPPGPEKAQEIPVRFYPFSSCPIVKTVIEGRSYRLKVDLGSYYEMSLRQEVLAKISRKTKLKETTQYADMKGNLYRSPLYEISPIYIGKIEGNFLLTKEEDLYYLTYGSTTVLPGEPLSKSKKRQLAMLHGRLGMGVFQKYHWLFDFPYSRIYFSDNRAAFAQQISHFVKASFFHETLGVILPIETDLGTKRFLLDTGTTYSCLKKTSKTEKEILHTQKFSLGNTNYGPCSLVVIDISDEVGDCDGILGIDFLRRHTFYLDFETSTAYFQPPRKTLFQRLCSSLKSSAFL